MPSPNWYGVSDENGQYEYHWSDGSWDAVAWQEGDGWKLGVQTPEQHVRIHLGEFDERTSFTDVCNRADEKVDQIIDVYEVGGDDACARMTEGDQEGAKLWAQRNGWDDDGFGID